jgi:hypothetical protein
MSDDRITIRIVGLSPLLMRAGRLADPLDPATQELDRLTRKRFKVEADHREVARAEWVGGLWLHEGRPCVPGEALEASFVEAARTRRLGRQAKAGLLVGSPATLVYEGPRDLEQLWEDSRFRLRTPVAVAGRRVVRTRPRFPHWSIEFEAEFLPALLDRRQILEIFKVAGVRCGLGDWRPKFGRYEVSVPVCQAKASLA